MPTSQWMENFNLQYNEAAASHCSTYLIVTIIKSISLKSEEKN